MKRIGILSDTHGIVPNQVYEFFKNCDEIWHAGDVGNADVLTELQAFKPLRAVYGNMDGWDVRYETSENQLFFCESAKILMTHIGGYPGKYYPGIRKELYDARPNLFVAGHSHILKVMYDDALECLHINPGAAGKQGWQAVRTLVKLTIDGKEIKDLEVVELS